MKIETDGPEMIVIPAGKFRMGDIQGRGLKVEQPVHEVNIRRPFAVSRYEITFDQYDVYARSTARNLPDDRGWGRGSQPVINVDWNDARTYANWLGAITGESCRLPSEAEWEYAARAGTTTKYALPRETQGSDGITTEDKDKALANCSECGSQWSGKQAAPVAQFPANAWGLRDMHGNVWEWVEDCYHQSYEGAPVDGRAWTDAGSCVARVLRGGSWNNDADNARSSARNNNDPGNRNDNIGFRVLCASHIVICCERRSFSVAGTAGIAGRLWLACRGCSWIDGAGTSRPHAAASRRAHIEAGRRLDSLPRRPPSQANPWQ